MMLKFLTDERPCPIDFPGTTVNLSAHVRAFNPSANVVEKVTITSNNGGFVRSFSLAPKESLVLIKDYEDTLTCTGSILISGVSVY